MSASISKKKNSIVRDLLKTTAGYIKGATGEYIKEVMPMTSSIIIDSKSTYKDIQTKLTNNNGLIQEITKMKKNINARKILDWYLDKENDFDADSDDENLTFDGVSSDEALSQKPAASLSPIAKSNKKVAKTIVETSHKMAEANIVATANIVSSIDKQTAIITSGFNKTHNVLNSILEVITKNTSTLIELATATRADTQESSKDNKNHSDDMLSYSAFSLSKYKKIIKNNIDSTELGAALPWLQLAFGMKGQFSGRDLVKFGISKLFDTAVPNLKNK